MNEKTETTGWPALEQLRALGHGNVGRTVSDDEWITAVCEGAIEEITSLRSQLDEMEAAWGESRARWAAELQEALNGKQS
jgi:hypothetical protein